MKTRFIYAILAIAMVAVGCNRDEASLFDQSASERARLAIDSANAILPSAVNGWDMVYFANTTSGGYHVLLKFDENTNVKAAAKNSQTTNNKYLCDSTSVWAVQMDYGPILTFNTYNKVMHGWADPRNDGEGYRGDYEFLILECHSNFIRLKGKKHSAYCYMRPIPAGKDWEEYIKEIEEQNKKIVGNGSLMVLKKDNKQYHLYPASLNSEDAFTQDPSSIGLYVMMPYGEEFDGDPENVYPYAVTEEGIQMQYGFNGDKKNALYSIVGNEFVAEDGSVITAGNLNEYFGNYVTLGHMGWTADIATSACPELEASVDKLKTYMKSVSSKAAITGIRLYYEISNSIYSGDSTYVAFQYTSNGKNSNSVLYKYDFSYTSDGIKLTYVAPKWTKNNTGEQVLAKFEGLEDILKAYEGEFTMTTENPLNPTHGSRITSKTNPNIYFDVVGTSK